jgi:hypothetical protein
MKVGDKIRVIKLPNRLCDLDHMKTKTLFELCLGRAFPIIGFNEYGMLELHVGEVLGERAFRHSIWIEPEFVEVVVP